MIKYSTSMDCVLSAKSTLMNIYARRKNWDEALKLADAFPNNIIRKSGSIHLCWSTVPLDMAITGTANILI